MGNFNKKIGFLVEEFFWILKYFWFLVGNLQPSCWLIFSFWKSKTFRYFFWDRVVEWLWLLYDRRENLRLEWFARWLCPLFIWNGWQRDFSLVSVFSVMSCSPVNSQAKVQCSDGEGCCYKTVVLSPVSMNNFKNTGPMQSSLYIWHWIYKF